MSITKDPDFLIHPGKEAANLALLQDQFFINRTQRSKETIDTVSVELFIILDLISEIRKEKENQGGDHVDLHHLDDKVSKFREVWNNCAYYYPGIIKEEENPFPQGKDLSHLSKKDLEWAETKIRNLETKHQGKIQTEMAEFETMTMAEKQIVEILVQIAKAIRESSGFYIKKSDNK